MMTSKKMQEVILALADKHGLQLHLKGTYVRLKMPHYDPLVIQVLHEHLVSIAHVYEPQPGVRIADPGIVFFTGYDLWVPIEVSQRIGGYRTYADIPEDLDDTIVVLPAQRADLVAFAELWAANLMGQGWLEDGIVSESSAQAM